MQLKMICGISHKLNGQVVASLWINDKEGNEYTEPFVKICRDRKEAIEELSRIMTGTSKHYDSKKMKFERIESYKLGRDEVFEYIGAVREE